MIHFRAFLNTDLPEIVRIWNAQPEIRGRVASITMDQFEQAVLSVPYFVHDDFVCAVDQERMLGFAHVAPVPSNQSFSDTAGVICQLLVDPKIENVKAIQEQLLAHAENRLLSQNLQQVFAGSRFPDSPFYVGLYGGSCVSGILLNEENQVTFFEQSGYSRVEDIIIFQRNLFESKSAVNRQILSMRRQYSLETLADEPHRDWWWACSMNCCEPTEFRIVPKHGGDPVGTIEYANLDSFSRHWHARAVGLSYIEIDQNERRTGMASFLIEESLRGLRSQAVEVVEAQASARNKVILDLLEKCSFQRVDRAAQLKKSLA